VVGGSCHVSIEPHHLFFFVQALFLLNVVPSTEAAPRLISRRSAVSRVHANGTAGDVKQRANGTFVRTFSLRWDDAYPSSLRKRSRAASPPSDKDKPKASHKKSPLAPSSPEAGRAFDVDAASSDPRGAFRCLKARQSEIPDAGKGLFASCGLSKDTFLGEYIGEKFMMGERGSAKRLETDWSYIWKVPRCLAGPSKVLTREDKNSAHECSNKNGFVYVDAVPVKDEEKNPLRYVNGAQTEYEKNKVNVEAFFADDRVWYYTTRDVQSGAELMVDYGGGYWKEAKTSSSKAPDELEADWGNFVNDE